MKLAGIVSRNKRKISRAFKLHSYWREKLSTSKGSRYYYHGRRSHMIKGECVWVY
jgi:hypothetical protein